MDLQKKLDAVAKIQDYIENHSKEPITLSQLAKVCNFSPWHTGRIFKELTGKTPFEYIRAYRLSQAAEMLLRDKVKVIDVAFDFVFNTHEGFSRSFSSYFGISPREYHKKQPSLNLFMPTSVRDIYLKLNQGEKIMSEVKAKTVFVQVVDRHQRKLILKRGIKVTHYFEYCEEVGCKVWDTLTNIKDAIYEPQGMWLPKNLVTPGTSVYAQGVEVPMLYDGEIPEGFDLISLPPCKMMIFQGQPYEDERFEDAINELWEIMKTYNPEIYGFKWADEDGPRFQLEPLGYRGYIEGRPVRSI